MLGTVFTYRRPASSTMPHEETEIFKGTEFLREWHLRKHLMLESSHIKIFFTGGDRRTFNKLVQKQEYYSGHDEKIEQRRKEIVELTEKYNELKEARSADGEKYKQFASQLRKLEEERFEIVAMPKHLESRTDGLFEGGAVRKYKELLHEATSLNDYSKFRTFEDRLCDKEKALVEDAYKCLSEAIAGRDKLLKLEAQIKDIGESVKNFGWEHDYSYKQRMYELETEISLRTRTIVKMEKGIPQPMNYLDTLEHADVELDIWIDGVSHEKFIELLKNMVGLKIRRLFISHIGNETWFRNLEGSAYLNFENEMYERPDLNVAQEVYMEVPTMDECVKVEAW